MKNRFAIFQKYKSSETVLLFHDYFTNFVKLVDFFPAKKGCLKRRSQAREGLRCRSQEGVSSGFPSGGLGGGLKGRSQGKVSGGGIRGRSLLEVSFGGLRGRSQGEVWRRSQGEDSENVSRHSCGFH